MSRSGYSDDFDNWSNIRWRGQVTSAARGKRGQAFFRELVEALESMPVKRLIRNDLIQGDGEVCAIGAVGLKRGVKMEGLDPEDPEGISEVFGIAHQLVQEIEYKNDECGYGDTPEERWTRMHAWAKGQIRT